MIVISKTSQEQSPASSKERNLGQIALAVVGNRSVTNLLEAQLLKRYIRDIQPLRTAYFMLTINMVYIAAIRSNDLKARQNQIAATIDEVQAAFENAQNDFRRFQSLFDAGSASKKELEDATTRFKMAEAKLASVSTMKDELNEMASYADLRAPYNGVVGQ